LVLQHEDNEHEESNLANSIQEHNGIAPPVRLAQREPRSLLGPATTSSLCICCWTGRGKAVAQPNRHAYAPQIEIAQNAGQR